MHNKRYLLVWFFIGLPIIAAALVSQAMWGYVLGRPASLTGDFAAVDSITLQTMVQMPDGTMSTIDDQPEGFTTYDEAISTCDLHAVYHYMPNDVPIFRAAADLYDIAPVHLSRDQHAINLLTGLLNTETLTFAPPEHSHMLTDQLAYKGRAVLISGQDANGDPLLHISMTTGELHNDDYIFYEYLLRPSQYDYDLLASQWFNYDVAGMEGFEFPVILPFFMVLALPLILASLWWARRGGEKRKRHYLVQ